MLNIIIYVRDAFYVFSIFLGDKILPKGISIAIADYFVHRDPNVFPEPEIFKPDRFTPENLIGRSPYSYIPFSAGISL
jgi:cytochrome P450